MIDAGDDMLIMTGLVAAVAVTLVAVATSGRWPPRIRSVVAAGAQGLFVLIAAGLGGFLAWAEWGDGNQLRAGLLLGLAVVAVFALTRQQWRRAE